MHREVGGKELFLFFSSSPRYPLANLSLRPHLTPLHDGLLTSGFSLA